MMLGQDRGAGAETEEQFLAAKFGANVGDPMSDLYGENFEDETPDQPKTVRFTAAESEELKLIVDFYTELRRIRGKRGKVKEQTVLRRATQNFISGFWDWLAQGRPETAEERERVVRLYLEAVEKQLEGAKKKPK